MGQRGSIASGRTDLIDRGVREPLIIRLEKRRAKSARNREAIALRDCTAFVNAIYIGYTNFLSRDNVIVQLACVNNISEISLGANALSSWHYFSLVSNVSRPRGDSFVRTNLSIREAMQSEFNCPLHGNKS